MYFDAGPDYPVRKALAKDAKDYTDLKSVMIRETRGVFVFKA